MSSSSQTNNNNNNNNNQTSIDPYAHFREVPNFYSNNGSSSNDNIMRQYWLMKKIAGSDIDNSNGGNGRNYY